MCVCFQSQCCGFSCSETIGEAWLWEDLHHHPHPHPSVSCVLHLMSLQCMSQLNLKSESFPALLILLKCLKKEDGVQFFRQLVPLFYHSCWILSCKKDKTAQKWIRIKASPNIVFIPHIQVFSWSYCEAVRAVEKKAFFRNIFEESRMFWEHISCNLCVESCGCKAQPWTSVSSFFFLLLQHPDIFE